MKTELTDSRVKALFRVASMPEQPGGPYAALLARAIDPTTAVDELSQIKEQAKLFLSEAIDRERDDATLLYHATVAAAFVHHGAKISGRALHKQLPSYEQFAAAWEGQPIGQLFQDAVRLITAQEPPA